MANPVVPPPLFENIDILGNETEDDLFVSAHQDPVLLPESESVPAKLDVVEIKESLENIPINNHSNISPSTRQVTPQEELEKEDEFLEISITKTQKIAKGMGAYMAYRITTRINMPMFKKKEFLVSRRFSDFLGLHDKLIDKYLKVGRIIPPAPKKSAIGMTKIKMSSQDSPTTNGNAFVERRRASLELYLKRTAQHPVLVLFTIPEKQLVCPIYEMVTDQHDARSIGYWLEYVKDYVIIDNL